MSDIAEQFPVAAMLADLSRTTVGYQKPNLEREAAEMFREIARLKRGDFTPDEIHGFCHKLPETVSAEDFAAGCAGWQRMHYGRAPHADRALPAQMDDQLLWILGRPNFTVSPIANLFRHGGHDIPRRSENEQAFVLFWMLGLYLKHGAAWRDQAEAELRALRERRKHDRRVANEPNPDGALNCRRSGTDRRR